MIGEKIMILKPNSYTKIFHKGLSKLNPSSIESTLILS